MIIECINCGKKFVVNSDLIPSEGRTIQCGSCNHIWFFNKYEQDKLINLEKDQNKKELKSFVDIEKNTSKDFLAETIEKKEKKDPKNQLKSSFTLGKFLSYILVTIISLIALIILIDTFKSFLYEKFPDLETLLFSLFETLKDIKLFIKDLITND